MSQTKDDVSSSNNTRLPGIENKILQSPNTIYNEAGNIIFSFRSLLRQTAKK